MTDDELAAAIAAGLCKRFEGIFLKPYLCPALVPTIGAGATYYENGVRVTLADPAITMERAMSLLMFHIRQVYLPAVKALCPGCDTPEHLAAIVDFCFNLGQSALRSSTMRRYINLGRWTDVKRELLKWVKAGGRVQRGLQLRRQAECLLL